MKLYASMKKVRQMPLLTQAEAGKSFDTLLAALYAALTAIFATFMHTVMIAAIVALLGQLPRRLAAAGRGRFLADSGTTCVALKTASPTSIQPKHGAPS